LIVRFLLPTAIVLGFFVYMHGGGRSSGATASVTQECGAAPGTVNVTIDWPPPAIAPEETWVDFGLAPSFAPGSFHGNGPIASPQTNARIDALPDGVTVYYRVNTRAKDAWRVQASGSFTTGCAPTARVTPTPAVDVVGGGG